MWEHFLRSTFSVYFCCFTFLFSCVVECKHNVVLVVIDGLKSDILTANSSILIPNLEGIINGDGIYVKDITPEFPALRLPFLTSLVTGRHSQEHGVLGNEVYDEVSEKIWKVEEDGDLFWEKAKQMKNVWV